MQILASLHLKSVHQMIHPLLGVLSLHWLQPSLPPHRLPTGLLADRRLLQEPLPGGAAAQGGECSSAGVQGDPSECHPGSEGPDDQAHLRWPLHLQSRLLCSLLVWVAFRHFWPRHSSCRASRPGLPRCTCPCSASYKRTSTGSM